MFLGGHNRNILGIGLGIPRHEIRVEDGTISSIKTTAQFYNEIRLETGYTDTQNVNPLTNFADSAKPNATQATPSKQGEFVDNEQNGHPAVLQDGVDDFYDINHDYESVFQNTFYLIGVTKRISIAERFSMICGLFDGGGNRLEVKNAQTGNSALTINYFSNGNTLQTDQSYNPFSGAQTNFFIWGVFANADTKELELWFNGSKVRTDQNNSIVFADFSSGGRTLYIGASNEGTPNRYGNQKQAAFTLVGGTEATKSNFNTNMSYLNSKYAIY